MAGLVIEDLSVETHAAVRSLILAGLAQHWGSIDEGLNPELDNMLESYAAGRTVVARDASGRVVGTGTVMPGGDGRAEIKRMSVDFSERRSGIGRQVVEYLAGIAHDWGCSIMVLETNTDWVEVVEFYLGCGFRITHTEAGDFGEDTWFERAI